MRRFFARAIVPLVIGAATASAALPAMAESAPSREIIVFVRHGEKPPAGLGQLDCQGLNRALALPAVIETKFGRPDAVFAPDPAKTKDDDGRPYDYVRPLATIEPTAIKFGLPVDTSLAFSDLEGLRKALDKPDYRGATVLVAWEHKLIDGMAKSLLAAHGGDPSVVPKWSGADFDSVYKVTIMRAETGDSATFEHDSEGLDDQPKTCPK